MKAFRVMRNNKPTIILEFSFRDVFKLLFGRELCLNEQIAIDESVLMRNYPAYVVFNIQAAAEEYHV